MENKKLSRVTRRGRIAKEQISRDREIKRKVEAEFPPAPPPPIPEAISEALKKAIQESGSSVYQIAKRARVSPIVISRFISGERDIRMATADKLANALGLRLTVAS